MFPEIIRYLDCGHVARGGEIAGRCSQCGGICCRMCLKICTGCGRTICLKCARSDDWQHFYCEDCWQRKRLKDGVRTVWNGLVGWYDSMYDTYYGGLK